jgi:DNA-nicking Smr family endonuclease
MPRKKDHKDIFLQSLSGVTPIKKSNKNFKKIKITEDSNPQKNIIKKNANTNLTTEKENKSKTNKDYIIQNTIQTSPLNKKLKKGKIPIDKKVDFHGLSVELAKIKFLKTIDSCFYSNKRCILFITGKGINKNNFEGLHNKLYEGKIRNEILNWANQKNVVSKILNISLAGYSHGGDGAFFVYLRKNKN